MSCTCQRHKIGYLGEVQRLPDRTLGVPGVHRMEARSSFGPFQERDIGKRVYRVAPYVLQMDNDEQLEARRAKLRHGIG